MSCRRSSFLSLFVASVVSAWASPVWAVGEGTADGFPNWGERVVHEWMNRARCDPQIEMTACGSACGDAACYTPMPPMTYEEALNRSARFHSDEMVQQNYFAHDSICTIVNNISTTYPASCNAAASCACVGGTDTCMPACTTWDQRIGLFGAGAAGEIIASDPDPNGSFYLWLYEPYMSNVCQFTSQNGHRWLILTSTGPVGTGVTGLATGDFSGDSFTQTKIPSGSHYPQQASSIDMWANWYDTAGPSLSTVNVDGTCQPMTLQRGVTTNGAYQATVTSAASGCHRYYFLFKDSAGNEVDYPTTGSLAIGAPSGSCPDWDPSRPPAGAGCSSSCVPMCGSNVCGDDGCGGSCGTCSGGTTCQGGQCVGGGMDSGSAMDSGAGGMDSGGGGTDSGGSVDSGSSGEGGPAGDGGGGMDSGRGDGGGVADGGRPGMDGGNPPGGGDAAGGGDGGAAAGDNGSSSGCGCRVGASGGAGALWLGVIGLLAAAEARRRRRGR